MDTNQIKIKFEQADQHLEAARSELNRPAEDVVPFMVCRNARYSVSSYLQGFLMIHGIESNEEVSTELLLEECRAIDAKFNKVDLSAIKFSKDDEYSAEIEELESCIDLAKYAKKLVSE